jgi:type I restriction-modification system DNA methylase subunit
LNITILDPACGSGAFLNQALEFLIEEHKKIDELKFQLLGGSIVFPDVEAKILEKNIYGVDLNEESVEIAKLSLWLRTAQKGRKLTTLSNHIKCGNSLIDDPEVAGEKAFNWQNEFSEIFDKGGFDVIIGNPPYVDIKGLDNEFAKQLFEKFSTTENRINLYSIFIEQGFNLLKNSGFLSYINPNSILVNSSYTKIRKLLIDNITSIIKLPDAVFEDATVETIILEFRKNVKFQDAEVILYQKDEKISQIDKFRIQKISKEDWKETESNNYNIYVNSNQLKILKKIEKNTELKELAEFTLGITPYDKNKGHNQEQITSRAFHSDSKLDENYKPLISGQNITRYFVDNKIQEYINYGDWLGAMRDERFFTEPRILVRQIVSGNPPRIYAGFTDKPLYFTQIGFGIIPKGDKLNPKYLLALINSQLINFYHKYRFLDLEKELFQKILIANCKQLPIKIISLEEQNSFIEKVDSILLLFENLKIKKTKFLTRLIDNFNIEKITKKIDGFYNYDFKSLISELKKQSVELSLVKQDELDEYFNSYKTEINEIQSLIEESDKDLDEMVYKLYDLTQEEIKTVEESY